MTSPQELKSQISQIYAQQLRDQDGCCEAPGSEGIYPVELLERMPEGTVSFGCGNPVALASLRPGERVLDLGSGAGLDCLLAAQQVGPEGSVVGVDFTQDMIDRATENADKLGLGNVSFRLGDIEALPLEDVSVDAVISNCVINLAPDKPAVFREAFRVLSPGGRLMISDIVLTRPATDEEMADLALLAGCISGSLPAEEYLDQVQATGFEEARLEVEHEAEGEQFWFSAAIFAVKPL